MELGRGSVAALSSSVFICVHLHEWCWREWWGGSQARLQPSTTWRSAAAKLCCWGVVWWCSLGGEELVEFGEAAVVVGLVDDFFGGLEVVGDGWLVLV